MYRFTTSADARTVDHVHHNGEEWHAYLCDLSDDPEWVTGDTSGWCCHDCQLIIVESFAGV